MKALIVMQGMKKANKLTDGQMHTKSTKTSKKTDVQMPKNLAQKA